MAAPSAAEAQGDLLAQVQAEYEAQCGERLSRALAAFMLRAVVLEQPQRFDVQRELAAVERAALVRLCVERLLDDESVPLATIRLQVGFDEAFDEQQRALDEQARAREATLQALLADVVAAKPRTATANEALYRKLQHYCATVCRLDTNDATAMRALASTQESVLPRSEIPTLVAMQGKHKAAQVRELGGIVAGIMLFNMESGRGGAYMDNAVERAQAAGSELQDAIEGERGAIERSIADITLVLNHMHARGEVRGSRTQALKDELALRQQFSRFLGSLGDDAASISAQISEACEAYVSEVGTLTSILSDATSVAADTVYPRFSALSSHWHVVVDRMLVLGVRRALLAVLAGHRPGASPVADDDVESAARALGRLPLGADDGAGVGAGAGTDATAGASRTRDAPASAAGDAVERVEHTVPNIGQLPLELNGYCPWAIVHRGATLLKGNRGFGLLRYQGKYYAFTSHVAMRDFQQNAKQILEGVLAECRRAPELIHLLGVESKIGGGVPRLATFAATATSTGALGGATRALDEMSLEEGCQTELHPVPAFKDPSYEWSEWGLRRRALQLSDMRNKQTHSVQTEQSHFRRETDTQTYAPKPAATQTMQNKGTNPVRRTNFVAGLRGAAPGTRAKVVQLQLELK